MSTIAFDGDYISGDSRMVIGNTIRTVTKVFYLKNRDIVFGFAGNVEDGFALKEWLEKGFPGDSKPALDEEFSAIVAFLHSGQVFHLENKCIFSPIEDSCYSIGSGGDFATAAMLCGKSSYDAVEIASRLDTNTGGAITTYCVKKVPVVKKQLKTKPTQSK